MINLEINIKSNLILLSDEDLTVLKKYKVWAKRKFMGREFMGILRTTFLIDPKGKIIKIWENVKVKDHRKRCS
jgi:peroxiredoxin Q/BCP